MAQVQMNSKIIELHSIVILKEVIFQRSSNFHHELLEADQEKFNNIHSVLNICQNFKLVEKSLKMILL